VGFAASIYLRGVRYIQIPTTLLAQVDSAHGGKTGVNFLGCKNQIGSFCLPIAVVIDRRFLTQLREEQIIDGLGEIIKAGLIRDPSILTLLKKETVSRIVKSQNIEKVIRKAIAVKQFYVGLDFRDNNLRQILNFGHTIGHAIELKYAISHGRAIIIGMLQELAFTEKFKLTDPSIRENLSNLLISLGVSVDEGMRADWKTIFHDKKITNGKIVFPVVRKEGKAVLRTMKLADFKKIVVH
jgi:3-dehydroquinate synthase